MSDALPPDLQKLETLLRQTKPRKVGKTLRQNSKPVESIDLPEWMLGIDPNVMDEIVRKARLEVEAREIVRQNETPIIAPYRKPRTVDVKPSRLLQMSLCLVLALIVGWIYSAFRGNDNKQTNVDRFNAVARIIDSVDAVWEEGNESYKTGQDLEPATLKLRSGVVRMEFGNGSEVTLEGPTELLVKNRTSAFCRLGQLSVFVPPQGKGFEVATPTATVVDLGTAFSMQITEETAEVHVIKGKVEVHKTGKAPQLLTDGLALLFDIRNEPKTFAARPATFFSNEQFRQRKTEYIDRRSPVWEAQKQRRNGDPSLLASLADVTVQRARRIPGLHPDREAFRLTNVRDRLNLAVPGEHRNLTLLTVVRLEDVKEYNAVLCTGNAFPGTAGEFLLQVDRSGKLIFHVIHPKGTARLDVPDAVTRSSWKTWMQIAVVVDADNREVRQYVDGRRIAVHPWSDPIPLQMRQGTIGNDRAGSRSKTVRFWNGDIDSFDLFSRAFSDEEIAELFEDMN